MRVIGSILLLLANAVTCRREKRPLFNRVAVLISPILGTLAYDSYGISLARVTGILSGIFHSTLITHSFDINLYAIGDVIFNPIQNDLLALSMIFFLLLRQPSEKKYENAYNDKVNIIKDNRRKAGVYC